MLANSDPRTPIIMRCEGVLCAWVAIDGGGTQGRRGKVRMAVTDLTHAVFPQGAFLRTFDFDKIRV